MGPRILTPEQRRIALTMAALGSILPVVIVTVDDFGSHSPTFLVGAALAAAAPVGSILASPHRRWLRWPFAFSGLPGLTLLQAETGGVGSPYAILLVMGMIWFGLMASDGELRAGIAVTIACCFVPMLVIGPPAYPVDVGLATTLALVNCSVLLGLAATTRQIVRLTDRLRHDANHDRLTGLLNRRGWDDAVDTHFGRKPPAARVRVVALIDLDQLKKVNDTLGHDRGDALLCSAADGLRTTFASTGVVSRLGGDEFAVLVLDRSEAEVVSMLADLRTETGKDGAFSAGVVTVRAGDAPGGVMRRADLALYEAKTTGRNRTCVAGEPLSQALAHATRSSEASPTDRPSTPSSV
ncbi:GGDEF domain-containing protein [Nocardioides sp.]|uniref:GGDEF domain-containing protein n=1 Tax=Nocardioides sp. TaxID=35761 RepID=UPI001A1E35D0|nr:GGDEF domain-containing protein [Nocardioides sp.]MBJ7358737.1 GGDEF domain-containing protein [Nocardioides sp.]